MIDTPNHPATLAQLHALLDAGLQRSATYRTGLSNHLPMAQQALLELGASAGRLRDWGEAYAAQLEPQPAPQPGREAAWGDPASDAAWRQHFAARIAQVGADATLREALPALLDGVAAIAFHGLIRTGHAVLAGHDGELAAALGHWAAQHQPLPVDASDTALPLASWLAALVGLPRPAYPAGSLISGRMQAWGRSPGFAAVAGRLQIDDGTLRELALLAAHTYAESRNFTVLHLLTACHAMTVLQPWWPAPALPRSFTVAAAAGLLASGATPVAASGRMPQRSWDELARRACAQDDEHVVKLTHAAMRLDRRWPDPAWRLAAERANPV